MNRYIAQERVEEIGKEGQSRLYNSRVAIVGCGALGSPVAMYLAAAGVGNIIIADFDTVEVSNLHRQVFYAEEDCGKLKVEVLKKKLKSLNSSVKINTIAKVVTPKLLETLQDDLQPGIIIDAADNPSTTYMLDDHCFRKGIPLITAGVTGWEAQIFVSCPRSISYSEIFPKPEDDGAILPCSIAGITGPTAALAASIQSSEAIKYIVGAGERKSRLIIANLLNNTFKTIF